MQQRYYDPRVARFWSVDPVTVSSAGGNFNRYWYANNNPYRFTDPDGRVIKSANPDNNEKIEKMINSIALGTFKFDDNGRLQVVSSQGDSDNFSEEYGNLLSEAIDSKNTISIQIADTYTDARNFDPVRVNGGLTQGLQAGAADQNVVITGHEYTGEIRDTTGASLTETPAFVLMHELVGHAIPGVLGQSGGNAVDSENKVRLQIPGVPLRGDEPWHTR